VLLRVFALILALSAVTPNNQVSAQNHAAIAVSVQTVAPATPDSTVPTGDTINDFYPEQQSLGDCLSSLPKPNCGSDARGGWRQSLVLIVILGGLAFIAWRIVSGSRKAKSPEETT